MRHATRTAAVLGLVLFALHAPVSAAPVAPAADPIGRAIGAALTGLDTRELATGVLLDRVVPLAHVERFDGGPGAPELDRATFRQACDELTRAGAPVAASAAWFTAPSDPRMVPLALVDVAWERIAPDAIARGALAWRGGRWTRGSGAAFERGRSVLGGPVVDATWHGGEVTFVLDAAHLVSDDPAPLSRLELDAGDGSGWRSFRPGERVPARYATVGPRTVRLRVTRADGRVSVTSARLEVAAVTVPAPDETLQVTGAPYLGTAGTGRAYVYRGAGRTALANPVIVVEGFDLDNSMGWDQLYTLLHQEGLIDTLHARGFDAVVLDFTDATDHLQRNAAVVEALVAQVRDSIPPGATSALVGASMGGLLGRYALADMETHGVPHGVRTFLSFDAPHAGADIPLGIQYWMQFFSGQSSSAATLLAELNRPAARQMLLYHVTDPPSAAAPDPMRATFLADLATAGGFPLQPRTVAIANGSGSMVGQGFAPGAQIILYQYNSFLITIRGNVWALPAAVNDTIFDGRITIPLIQNTTQTVKVSGTVPYDDAPGGWRASMTQMDTTAAPYGDIIALYPHHCFIPTISALALDIADPSYDIAGDAGLLTHTPFDAVYYPVEDQEHVAITPQNAAWFLAEVTAGLTGVGAPGSPARALELVAAPNPSHAATRLRFTLAEPAVVELTLLDVTGRRVRTFAGAALPAGPRELVWDGRDDAGRRVPAGLYFARLASSGRVVTRRLVRID